MSRRAAWVTSTAMFSIVAVVLLVMIAPVPGPEPIRPHAQVMQSDPTYEPALGAEVEITMTAPADVPTPHVFQTGAEVLEWVKASIQPPIRPVQEYAKRSFTRDFDLLKLGPGSQLVTPDPTFQSYLPFGTPELGPAVWVVGIQAMDAINHDELAYLSGMAPNPIFQGQVGFEMYVVLDDIGNVLETGFLDNVTASGMSSHFAPWHVEDIADLPEAPTP